MSLLERFADILLHTVSIAYAGATAVCARGLASIVQQHYVRIGNTQQRAVTSTATMTSVAQLAVVCLCDCYWVTYITLCAVPAHIGSSSTYHYMHSLRDISFYYCKRCTVSSWSPQLPVNVCC
jgi:hypothetical protein